MCTRGSDRALLRGPSTSPLGGTHARCRCSVGPTLVCRRGTASWCALDRCASVGPSRLHHHGRVERSRAGSSRAAITRTEYGRLDYLSTGSAVYIDREAILAGRPNEPERVETKRAIHWVGLLETIGVSVLVIVAVIVLPLWVRRLSAPMARVMRIAHVALWTHDLERCKRFYASSFGAVVGRNYVNVAKGFESCFLSFSDGARLER